MSRNVPDVPSNRADRRLGIKDTDQLADPLQDRIGSRRFDPWTIEVQWRRSGEVEPTALRRSVIRLSVQPRERRAALDAFATGLCQDSGSGAGG